MFQGRFSRRPGCTLLALSAAGSRLARCLIEAPVVCRRKATGALEALHITPAQSHTLPALSATSVSELFALPDAPPPALAPAELVRFAQTVDTALFKSYLLVRPGLLGPLCRQPNWCAVRPPPASACSP